MNSASSSVFSGSSRSLSLLPSASACSPSASAFSETSSQPCPAQADEALTEAQKLYSLLVQFEREQDRVFTLGAQLMGALVSAQQENRLAQSVGHPAFVAFSQVVSHLTAARGSTVDGHRALEKMARAFRIGFRPDDALAYGDVYKYPSMAEAAVEERAAA